MVRVPVRSRGGSDLLCEVVLFLRGAPVGGRSRSNESSPLLHGHDTEAGRLEHTGGHTTEALNDVTVMEMLLYEVIIVVNNRWENKIFHLKMYLFFNWSLKYYIYTCLH